MDGAVDLYNKSAPRWFKVIRWKEWAQRFYKNQKLAAMLIYVPSFIIYYSLTPDRFATWLFLKRPKTQEEFDALKRDARFNHSAGICLTAERNFEIGQYKNDMPPLYDLAVRRKAYPEYYAGRYDKFKRDRFP